MACWRGFAGASLVLLAVCLSHIELSRASEESMEVDIGAHELELSQPVSSDAEVLLELGAALGNGKATAKKKTAKKKAKKSAKKKAKTAKKKGKTAKKKAKTAAKKSKSGKKKAKKAAKKKKKKTGKTAKKKAKKSKPKAKAKAAPKKKTKAKGKAKTKPKKKTTKKKTKAKAKAKGKAKGKAKAKAKAKGAKAAVHTKNTAKTNADRLKKYTQSAENAKYLGDVNIQRILQTREVVTGNALIGNLTVKANLDCGHVISANRVNAKVLAADTLVTGALNAPSGVMVISADLYVSASPNLPNPPVPNVRATSLLAENVVLGGVPQWKLVRHEDFENGADGWSLLETSSCEGRDHFLGGHCNIGDGEVSKVFNRLPPHKQVRVTARYHFIDNWKHETAFLKLGEHYAWAHHHSSEAGRGIHMCGSDKHAETKMSMPIDVVQAHSASFLEVSFGSKAGADSEQDPCDRSFGVDDVMIYVR